MDKKYIDYVALFISALALITSLYSVSISHKSQEFQTTQVKAEKANELVLMLHKYEKLLDEESLILIDILPFLESHKKLTDEDGSRYKDYSERYEFNELWSEEVSNILYIEYSAIKDKDIEWLVSSIGHYEVSVNILYDQIKRERSFLRRMRNIVSENERNTQSEDNNSLNKDAQ